MISLPSTLRERVPVKVNRPVADSVGVVRGKRFVDLVIAGLVTLFVLSWLLPVLSVLICFTSRGPALYMQLRTGRNGRAFRFIKFRTMTYERNAAFRQAIVDDCRITPVGRWLRRTNIDEMPQFLNVLWGDMSVVGPRPHPLALDAQHWYTLPGYPDRYAVKPGITGLAQVRGCRGETSQLIKMQHRVRYDQLYIRRQSVGFDLKICWWTVIKTIQGDEKAY